MQEKWKFIYYNGVKTKYKVSSLGRFISLRTGKERFLNPKRRVKGYIVFCLKLDGGEEYTQSAHRLVAKAFHKNPNNYPQVLHSNDIKDDNRACNLSWGNGSKNTQDAYDRGLAHGIKGENHYNCKLSNENIMDIFNSPESAHDISKKYNIGSRYVSQIKRGQCRSYVTGKKYERRLVAKDVVVDIFKCDKPVSDICVKYCVTTQTVLGIKSGRYWSSITGAIYVRSRLTPDEVLCIYNSKESNKTLAEKFGVKRVAIWRIKAGIYWSEITGHTKPKE